MANPEHVKILKQGVGKWNKWRKKNPEIRPNLYEENLREMNFENFDLYGTNFSGADLEGAIFKGVNLSGADFNWAKLMNADFSESRLLFSTFMNSKMKNTKFDNSFMGYTTLANVNLEGVKGLESVQHEGPSNVDINTLIAAKGKISKEFLKGVGWPDEYIEHIHPLAIESEIQYYSGFISYSHEDEDFVKRLHNDLQGEGVRVWYAPEDLKIGQEFGKVINREIRLRDKLILVFSENSVKSDWVAFEVEQAEKEERKRHPNLPEDKPLEKPVLFPIKIDDAVDKCDKQWAWRITNKRQVGDFRGWEDADKYKKAFEHLLDDLRKRK